MKLFFVFFEKSYKCKESHDSSAMARFRSGDQYKSAPFYIYDFNFDPTLPNTGVVTGLEIKMLRRANVELVVDNVLQVVVNGSSSMNMATDDIWPIVTEV